jgi:hypothetical protein
MEGTTCASLSLFGNEAISIVLFISIVIGLLTIGFAIFKIITEIRMRSIIPTAHNSDSPLLRQPITPTAHFSNNAK